MPWTRLSGLRATEQKVFCKSTARRQILNESSLDGRTPQAFAQASASLALS